MKTKTAIIYVENWKLVPQYQLAISAACDYYNKTREELFEPSKTAEHSRQKYITFYILKHDCQLTDNDIANITGTTRQNVARGVNTVDVRKRIYLQSACDYENIKLKLAHLLKQQQEWIQQLSL
ncbi:MAG: hypothetical protein ABS44_11770 [Chryseobacterium sp. SCN 40-13]|nr:MAG: hypothetical protein ABS44_11770 [Chryseobacterium sp. SCN 40-13]